MPAGLFDSHTHTPLCQHASGTPTELAQAALEAGLAGIVFTDHMPMPRWYDAPWRMSEAQLPLYVESVLAAREAFAGRLEVRLGLEADYHPGTERFVERILSSYPFDYVIGSVHYLGAWGFDNPEFVHEYEERDLTALWRSYYALTEAAARSGLFDAIGHLDLPKKFGHRNPQPDLAHATLEAVAAEGLALDYNTAGWRKAVAEPYPAQDVVLEAVRLGIPFVLGSDAHAPGEVGHRFAEAAQTLHDAGAQIVTFRGREVQRG
ncbi:histidinol-phosphatase HisJ family protein [Deinobacterium chartae]|uniref:histidinol-phosphatase HisJ family protein n=1 Tax=Deinobacterium chartae TaxID=521158 RepID=UPI0016197E96|nr:histidinol-phosphatase HisJ family protein [Deinobacterium chartae]